MGKKLSDYMTWDGLWIKKKIASLIFFRYVSLRYPKQKN